MTSASDHAQELERLRQDYRAKRFSPLALGKALVTFRRKSGMKQRRLSKLLGTTPGVIHHYESLILKLDPWLAAKLDSGKLTFKEARCIADIDDLDRQWEIARPFIRGELSSTHVEPLVALAKRYPELAVSDLVARIQAVKTTQPQATFAPRQRLYFRSCPRCSGTVQRAGDQYGDYLKCLMCGWHYYQDGEQAA